MLTPAQQTARQLQWFARHGVDRLDLAVQPRAGTWVAPHQNLDAAGLSKLLPWCRAENAGGSNVYVRPHRHSDVPMVFLDDVTVTAAMTLAQMHPALVLETSANRCHVWIVVDRVLRENERSRLQATLVARLVEGKPLADPGSTSGDHYGRLCGFRNRKVGRDCWVNLRVAVDCGAPLEADDAAKPACTITIPRASVTPACVAPRNATSCSSESEREWGWVMRQLESGAAPHQLVQELTQKALARRGPDALRYALRTVGCAVKRMRERATN